MNEWFRDEQRLHSSARSGQLLRGKWLGGPGTLLALLGAVLLLAIPALGAFSPSAGHPASPATAEASSLAQAAPETEPGFLAEYQDPKASQPALDSPDLLDVFAKLLLVLALAWLAGGAMKRFLGSSRGPGGGGLIRLVETCHLGPRRSLHLVEVAERTLLVGSTDQQMTLLSQWNGAEFGPERHGVTGHPEGSSHVFSHHLSSSLRPSDFPMTTQPAYRARTCLARLRTRVDALAAAARGGTQQ